MHYWQYRTLSYAWDGEKRDLAWADTTVLPVDSDMVDKRLNEL